MVLIHQPSDPTGRLSTQEPRTPAVATVDCLMSGEVNHAYSIVEDEDGPGHPRISAVDGSDVEIAGAFQPPERPYWLLYVTPWLAAAAGAAFCPDPLPLGSRKEAREWVSLVAQLYAKAAS